MSKKSFNLSLQKKRNHIVLNPIIESCDQDGSYVADKVVDYVEKALFFERSVGLSKVQNTYVLIKNTLSSQYPPDSLEFQQRVEDVLRSIISVDGERLAQFLSDPNEYSGGAGTLPASENRSTMRSTSPAPTQRAEESAIDRNPAQSAVAVAEPEPVQETEEEEHRRISEERAQKKAREREEHRQAVLRASQEQDAEEDDDEDDDDDIQINGDALNNF